MIRRSSKPTTAGSFGATALGWRCFRPVRDDVRCNAPRTRRGLPAWPGPAIRIRPGSSRRSVPARCSQIAFARGAQGGVLMISMASVLFRAALRATVCAVSAVVGAERRPTPASPATPASGRPCPRPARTAGGVGHRLTWLGKRTGGSPLRWRCACGDCPAPGEPRTARSASVAGPARPGPARVFGSAALAPGRAGIVLAAGHA
jgi:hypothetical protein